MNAVDVKYSEHRQEDNDRNQVFVDTESPRDGGRVASAESGRLLSSFISLSI